MSKQSVISARVDAETLALVDEVAAAHGRSRAWIAAEAIHRYVEQERAFLAFVQVGVDAVERGDVIEEAEMQAWFDEKLSQLAAAKVARAA